MRNNKGYSLIELMSTIVVLAIVISLLYSYQNRGWDYFNNSYTRGLSHLKARLAVKAIAEDLKEANRSRAVVGNGVEYNLPFPNDAFYNSSYLYFTKPVLHEASGEVVGYDYVLYYFAKSKQTDSLILKSIKFLNQSKSYTEDNESDWPFLPPLLVKYESQTDADREMLNRLEKLYSSGSSKDDESEQDFMDENTSSKLPVSSDFVNNALTDPFSKEDASFYFERINKRDTPINIKVSIKERGLFLGTKTPPYEFELSIIPRN